MTVSATEKTITSPDGSLAVTVNDNGGQLKYSVTLGGQQMLQPSRLGLKSNIGDFTEGFTIKSTRDFNVDKSYDMTNTKRAHIDFHANATDISLETAKGMKMTVTFVVDNNNVAFRYTIPRQKDNNPKCAIIDNEITSFRLPDGTTTFICPQSAAMIGWERSKPSYEEEYTPDAPMTEKSKYGEGYTFPCLFHINASLKNKEAGSNHKPQHSNLNTQTVEAWVLISETGVDGQYCGARLSDYDPQTGYTLAYPMPGENNGFGSTSASIMLPGSTPWRTITVGKTLKPIVETTVQFDVVEPRYEPSIVYKPGRYTWSWLIWQDNSANVSDQKQFIDLASQYGYERVLVDGLWDEQAGRKGIEELSRYAKSKDVSLMLWYNSNGAENDAPQGPRGIMNNAIKRKAEMRWMKSIGVTGIKVDFFGGDKQETLRLYEDILSDANDYGIGVIFHGCTMPRGWERMYPNYVSSEAALASENVYFSEYHAKKEGFEMTMYPYTRNVVGSFDWGGILMNDYLSKDNKSRHPRYTSRLFELATAITNQSSVNCVEVTPQSAPALNDVENDFLKKIPVAWAETQFIDGYPGKSFVVARKDAQSREWFVGGINGTDKPITTTLQLPMLAGKTVSLYYEDKDRHTLVKNVKINKKGEFKTILPQMGGVILH